MLVSMQALVHLNGFWTRRNRRGSFRLDVVFFLQTKYHILMFAII